MKYARLVVAAAALLAGCDLIVGIEPWSAGGAGGAPATSTGTASIATSTSDTGATSSANSTGSGCATCGGTDCIDLLNDASNCGACAVRCFGDQPSCDSGICAAATLTTLPAASRLATTPAHVVVAHGNAVTFVPKDADVDSSTVLIPNPPVTALAALGDQVFAATSSLYSVTAASQPKLIGPYIDPMTGMTSALDATSMTVGSWQGSTRVLIGSKNPGRPLIAAPLTPGTLATTTCTTSNAVLRVSAAGSAVARLATNDDARFCDMASISVSNANDLAVVAAPASVVVATDGALVFIEGMTPTPILENPVFEFLQVATRGDEIFAVVFDGATHRIMTTKLAGNSVGTIFTLYTSNVAITDLAVDAVGVYFLDKGGNVVAIGY